MDKFDRSLPLSQATALPGTWYTDAQVFDLERKVVFGERWIAAGRADQVKEPGHFFTVDIAGEPLVVARDDTGQLRGFFNVCRHRAARVVCEEAGCLRRFRCRYHGWTYDLSGRLSGVPEFDSVERFAREDNGLPAVDVEVWGPLVFIRMRRMSEGLMQYMNPMAAELERFRLEELSWFERRVYDLACNWKVYVDNYLDGGYHVNTLHKSLASVLDYAHYQTFVHSFCSVQSAPLRLPDSIREDATAGAVRQGSEAAYWWLYPNLMINAYDGVMDTNLVLPIDAGRCRVIFDFYFAKPHSSEFRLKSMAVADRIQGEDLAICEDVQRGLGSRSYFAGRYSVRREIGVHHFHRLLAGDLDQAGELGRKEPR